MGKFLWRLFLILLAALVLWLGFMLLTGRRIHVLGYTLLTVEGSDMDPTLPEGSLLIARRLKEDLRVKVSDIITYQRQGAEHTATGRVVSLSIGEDGNERYHVQGDNPMAAAETEPVRRGEIIGVYTKKLK